uniref:tubulin-glutamate carboxypeptidase n=1 Tax=Echeneis naucrates TaxID=173247 RepID=A0A665UYL5_ECHNA
VSLQSEGDVESSRNILNILDDLLSAGSERRIQHMISRGGSEALLMALVNMGHSVCPNYSILLPLLHLLAKVGHRDRHIGVKAQEAGAVLLVLNLLKHNLTHPKRAAACLWVIQVFSSSVSTANLIGQNHGLDLTFSLISQFTTKHMHTIRAAINAFAALLSTKANIHLVVSKGFISGLLRVYEDWHTRDTQHVAIVIRHTLLCCLQRVANTAAGRRAFRSQGGMSLLYQTTQTCLSATGLEALVEASMQIMRRCLPKTRLPLISDQSAYTFPLPGRQYESSDDDDHDYDEDEVKENQEAENRDSDEDLETDLTRLRLRPDPDRPKELLLQYSRLCPELSHDFEVLKSMSVSVCGTLELVKDLNTPPGQRGDGQGEEDRADEDHHCTMIDRLLERHGACVPHHKPKLYRTVAARTKSVPGFGILAFPDFWGHLPPPGPEPMEPRKPDVQRQKVLEDVQRFMKSDDIINQVVFDLEDDSLQTPPESLRFFSSFECGNLRKAIQVRRYEYDLVLNADVNSSHHSQWFYFEISNMDSNVSYRFNIINCEKSNSQFNYGMQPVLYSVRDALDGRPHWVRTGAEICYYRNFFRPARGRRRNTFYTLTFTVTFRHHEDVCYLAYHYPYTYSALKAHLKVLQETVDPSKVFFQQQILCSTLAGNLCPLVTITACPNSRNWRDLHQLRNRPCIVLTGRVHPGESNASWVMKGTLEFLCSNDPVAQSLREAFIFKIVPMLNPDGVINGMNRCDLSSEDLNRQWCKPEPVLSPTIYHTKGFLYYLNSIGRTPLVFCDYHGHSRKKNVFLYGCSVKETLWQSGSDINTTGLKEDPGYRTIPKTLDRIAPAFSFNSCNYLVEKSRSATARVVVWREMGVLRSYTMESTYNGCDQGIYKGLQMGTQELQEMGMKFCQSLLSVTRDMKTLYSRSLVNCLDLGHKILDHKSHNCFEDDEPPCVEQIEFSSDSPGLQDIDLDSDININMSIADEDCLFPHQISHPLICPEENKQAYHGKSSSRMDVQ